jgi:rubrerythrin
MKDSFQSRTIDEETALVYAAYLDEGEDPKWRCEKCGFLIDDPAHVLGCQRERDVDV